MEDQSNEIPAARKLVGRLDLDGTLVSLDALHSCQQTAREIVLEAGADYSLTIKDNRSTIKDRIESRLPDPGSPPFVTEQHPGRFTRHRREEKKRSRVTRELVCAPTTGEELIFPCAAQIARLHGQRIGRKPETVCLVTSRPAAEMSPEQWLEANIGHWGGTGLHARLDASRHDDRCRLRNPKPLRPHSMFTRVANSICCEWLSRHHKRHYVTTTDFHGVMAAEHGRATVSLVTSAKPRLPPPNPQCGPRA